MQNIIVKPPEKNAKLHTHNGVLLMYIGRVTVNGDTVTVVPCRGITDRDLKKLTMAHPRPEPGRWTYGPDGWTSHCSVRVDIDDTIASIVECVGEIDSWGTR
jgi:hypothetical protein